MKTNKTHNDLVGTVTADISNITFQTNSIRELSKKYKIDQNRLEVLGISILGTRKFYISFICKDKEKSTSQKDHIIKVMIEDKVKNLAVLFKHLHIVMFPKSDKKYTEIDIDEEYNSDEFTIEE